MGFSGCLWFLILFESFKLQFYVHGLCDVCNICWFLIHWCLLNSRVSSWSPYFIFFSCTDFICSIRLLRKNKFLNHFYNLLNLAELFLIAIFSINILEGFYDLLFFRFVFPPEADKEPCDCLLFIYDIFKYSSMSFDVCLIICLDTLCNQSIYILSKIALQKQLNVVVVHYVQVFSRYAVFDDVQGCVFIPWSESHSLFKFNVRAEQVLVIDG